MKTVIEMVREAGDDEWKIFIKYVMKHFPSEVHRFVELVRADERNATLDEIATKIAAMPFGDTAASFAVWIREQKR